nr:piggyBac transposable element-derived protein 3 [Parasteatoda tepidariorum]
MLNKVRQRCLKQKRPQIVSIDEQIIPFHGQVSMRQYVRGKPNPVGIKVFVMCTSYGLPLDFIFYEGKGTDVSSPEDTSFMDLGGKIVLKLSDSLFPGSSIYFDRYFTSELLLDLLLNRELYATGTLMKNKVPKLIQLKTDAEMRREGRGSINQIVRGDKHISLVKWFDNKSVLLLSTQHGKGSVTKCSRWSKKDKQYLEVDCPAIVKNYNDYMGGVDHLDRAISYYRMKNRTNKWTVRVILHMVDFVMSSAWLAYRNKMRERKKDILDYFAFRLDIATTLIHGLLKKPVRISSPTDDEDDNDEPPSRRRVRASIPHEAARSQEARHMPEMIGDRAHRSRCRNSKCSALTTVHCTDCKVFLCFTASRNCFKAFHENKKCI